MGNFSMRTYEKRIIILKKIYLQKASTLFSCVFHTTDL